MFGRLLSIVRPYVFVVMEVGTRTAAESAVLER
jgi:hypothetical protein